MLELKLFFFNFAVIIFNYCLQVFVLKVIKIIKLKKYDSLVNIYIRAQLIPQDLTLNLGIVKN